MNFLEVSGVTKQDGNGYVLNNITFTQQQFQKVAVIGETGSGKSTLLKIIAGLEQQDEGVVRFEGKKVFGPIWKLIPGHDGIVYLSQHFELPHFLRVEQVLEYANKISEEEADELYKICRIDHLMKRRTDQLSGGEKQRIALAKLLITSPGLLLLDEPFSNLDTIHKNILKKVINDISEKLSISCMMISHDPLETLSWADMIIVMKDGKIVQQGSPKEVYLHPVNEYAGGLLGNYNLIDTSSVSMRSLVTDARNNTYAFIRPEHIILSASTNEAIKAVISKVVFLGSRYMVTLLAGEQALIMETTTELVPGDVVYIKTGKDFVAFMDKPAID